MNTERSEEEIQADQQAQASAANGEQQGDAQASEDAEPQFDQTVGENDVTDAIFTNHAEQASADESDPQAELAAAQDRILRLQAEIDNVRRRARRELSDELRYASMPLLRALMPVLDNVDRAIEAAEKCNEAEGIVAGFRMVQEQLITALAQNNCTKIEALEQAFDPNLCHERHAPPRPRMPDE